MNQVPKDRSGHTAPAEARVLVLGDATQRLRAVARCLDTLRATVELSSSHDLDEALDRPLRAVVLVEPIASATPVAVTRIRQNPHTSSTPVFALVAASASSRNVRSIYASGATAVVEWPREREILSGILAETLGMTTVRGVSRRPDTALARTIRAHLRLGPAPGKALRVHASDGVVTISGRAPSLVALERVVETVAAVPGVKRVLTGELLVAPSGIPDRVVERDVSHVIRSMSEIDPDSLSVEVEGGRVKLRGEVSRRAHVQDLIGLVAHVKGVRDLDWEVEVSGGRSRSDADTARRLRRSIATLFPDEKVRIGVFDGVAVLTGTVSRLHVKREIEHHSSRDDGVERVVNKLVVGER